MKREILSKEILQVTIEPGDDPKLIANIMDCYFGERISDVENIPKLLDYQQNGCVREVKAFRTAVESNGGWAQVLAETDDFIKPYWERLKYRVGAEPFDLDFPELEKTNPAYALLPGTARYVAERGVFQAEVLDVVCGYVGDYLPDAPGDPIPAGMKNRGTFQEVAMRGAVRALEGVLGKTDVTPEYIGAGNGYFMRNPKYGTASSLQQRPYAENEAVNKAIWRAWLSRYGTPGQKFMAERAHKVFPHYTDTAYEDSNYQGFHLQGCRTYVSWEEFRALVDVPTLKEEKGQDGE